MMCSAELFKLAKLGKPEQKSGSCHSGARQKIMGFIVGIVTPFPACATLQQNLTASVFEKISHEPCNLMRPGI